MKRADLPKPLEFKEVEELPPVGPEIELPERIKVNLASFALPPGAQPRLVKEPLQSDTYRVQVELSGKDIEPRIPFERIPVTELSLNVMDQFKSITELQGLRPLDATLKFVPGVSTRDQEIRQRKLEKGDVLPRHIFGSDNRIIYQDTSFPWRTVGRVRTANGVCSGCTIGPRLVLTASHCIDWLSGGGAGWVRFSPAYYNGNGPWGEFSATRVLSWNKAEGGLSDLETAFDYVVLVMNDRVGDMVGYPGYRTYDDDWNGLSAWQHMGYPGDLTFTERPAFQGSCVISTAQSQSTSGQTGYVLGHFNDVTGGHSGGPIWGWWSGESWPRVVGVQSTEASVPAMNTSGDNEFGGGPGLSSLISYARSNYP